MAAISIFAWASAHNAVSSWEFRALHKGKSNEPWKAEIAIPGKATFNQMCLPATILEYRFSIARRITYARVALSLRNSYILRRVRV
jgi:hypothetical protein